MWAALVAMIRAFIDWFSPPKPTPKEKELTHDLAVAKQEEAAFVAPPRDKSALLERMRERADGR